MLALRSMAALISLAILPATPAQVEHSLDQAAKTALKDGGVIGMSVAVAIDGKIALVKPYGLASARKRLPVTQDSEFAIGSVSKEFTAACILLLQEDGKLSVDDKVGKYFPDLTSGDRITIRDVLNHVSGYSDWYPLDYLDSRLAHDVSPEYVRKTYGTLPLDFATGDHYSYSNTGYLIAARIVEKVTGRPFFEFLRRRILQPLGMNHTLPYGVRGRNFVERYTQFLQAAPEIATPESPGWSLGAGGLMSNPEDLMKWDIALMNGQVLRPESLALMVAPRKLNSGAVSNYGFGLVAGKYEG